MMMTLLVKTCCTFFFSLSLLQSDAAAYNESFIQYIDRAMKLSFYVYYVRKTAGWVTSNGKRKKKKVLTMTVTTTLLIPSAFIFFYFFFYIFNMFHPVLLCSKLYHTTCVFLLLIFGVCLLFDLVVWFDGLELN